MDVNRIDALDQREGFAIVDPGPNFVGQIGGLDAVRRKGEFKLLVERSNGHLATRGCFRNEPGRPALDRPFGPLEALTIPLAIADADYACRPAKEAKHVGLAAVAL